MLQYGWYPGGDSGRYINGFWDGEQWLILVTGDHLIIKGEWIAFNQAVQVSYWNRTRYSINLPSLSYTYRGFSVMDTLSRNITLKLDNSLNGNLPQNEPAWRGLVDISRQHLEPRISEHILCRLRTEDVYTIKDKLTYISLSNRGFTTRGLRTKPRRWADYCYAEANPVADNGLGALAGNNGQVVVYAQSGAQAKPRKACALSTKVPNAVALPTLMPMCAGTFA